MTYEIRENRQYNSREIYFDGKPSKEVRDSLKVLKMRWNHKKGCWYGYATEGELIDALLSAGEIQEEKGNTVVTDGYMGGGAKYGSKSNCGLYGADMAAAIRQDIKAAGIKGVTVRAGKATYTDTFTLTVTVETTDIDPEYKIPEYEAYDRLSRNGLYDGTKWRYLNEITPDENGSYIQTQEFQEIRGKATEYEKSRYSSEVQMNQYYLDRYTELTKEFRNKLQAVMNIVYQYHWDESNSMVDYFSTNFYAHLRTKPGKTWKTA